MLGKVFKFITLIALSISGRSFSFAQSTSAWLPARSTNYGISDQFQSDWSTGTGRCWGPDSYRPDIPCFDSISPPSQIAAVNTRAMTYTQTIGTCILVTCVNGPTRGLPYSTYPWPGCKPGNSSVLVQITDSCLCDQNPSNTINCCQNPLPQGRHLDLSTPAFTQIAEESAGIVDVLYQQITCPDGNPTGVSWASWEAKYGTTIQEWSQSKFNTLATVESACGASVEGESISDILAEDEAHVENRTGELQPSGIYDEQDGLNVTQLLEMQTR